MKSCSLFLIIIALLLASCSGNMATRDLEGLWLFAESNETDDVTPDCFLNLKKNGHYTLYIPHYFDYGYWKRDAKDSNLILFSSKRVTRYYSDHFSIMINGHSKNKLEITYTLPAEVSRAAGKRSFAHDQIALALDKNTVLQRSAVQYPDSLDPYSYGLNRWRIKPVKAESCEEISNRTLNYLRHMQALFREQFRQRSEYYGYPYSPSPLLYGQNGIATINFNEIPAYWKYTFYDDSQAKQSCAILYSLFDEKLHLPKNYKRPDELWANLLGQMVNHMRTQDYCSGQGPDTNAVR